MKIKSIPVGTQWNGSIKDCPICGSKHCLYIIDSMESGKCGKCGARFTPTFSGVIYVGQEPLTVQGEKE
jgi:hypothetical protein